jgi:hypothetical protein
MEKEAIQQIIKSNDILLETTIRLVEVNRESLQMTKGELSKNKVLMNYIKEEFQALSDKSKRSIQEESQYLFLRKLLLEK